MSQSRWDATTASPQTTSPTATAALSSSPLAQDSSAPPWTPGPPNTTSTASTASTTTTTTGAPASETNTDTTTSTGTPTTSLSSLLISHQPSPSLAESSSGPIPSASSSIASTSAAASTSATSQSLGHPSPGVSNGALAGAVVGSIAGTAALTLLGAFLFFRSGQKKKSQHAKAEAEDPSSGAPDSPTAPAAKTGVAAAATASHAKGPSLTSPETHLNLAAYIPAPADDNTVCTRIQTLFDQVSLHIDNYYSPRASSPTARAPRDDGIARFARFASPHLPWPLSDLLSKRMAQRATLTHVLVQTVLQDIQLGSGRGTLLPPVYRSGSAQRGVENSGFDFEYDRSLFAWRMLTAHVHNRDRSSEEEQLAAAARGDAATSLAQTFTSAFAQYSDAHFAESDRLDHLASVLRAAADLGVWLFAQPCSFGFRWSPRSGSAADRVAVFPAVVKVGDELGRRLLVQQVLAEEVTARI